LRFFILVTFLLSCAGSAALGARLVLAGLRTRTAPELAYGGSLLLMGIGGVVRLIVHGLLGAGPEYHAWIVGAAALRLLTLVALTYGIRAIYRPREAWATALMGGLWAVGGAGLAVVAAHPGGLAEAGQIYQLGEVVNGLAVLWGWAETSAYWGKLKRRLAVGLADRVTTQRFGIWSIGFACAFAANASLVGGTALVGGAITSAPGIMAVVQGFLLATTIVTWCAFYPPEFVRRRARAGDAGRGEAAER
jgi:hypothetical protein